MSGRACALLVALVVALDRWTKLRIVDDWRLGESHAVVPGFFSLTYLRNRGAAFGMFADLPAEWRVVFFATFALLVLAALLWMLRATPREDVVQRLALSGVIGGALGNLWDRLLYGEVVDFLDVYVGNRHWPAFNVADSFITCGVVLLLLASMRSSEHDPGDRTGGDAASPEG